ncbi:hypothetical protein [Sphingobium sp. D43FB]|uniref:hypothetical protein n=1 Tax=Sphingobium sp. D43FB TaxID=2017595 RepID=UPI000BB5372C|nr:hypothetical protein [Sphingobium sp. D43FB]PBN41502.1 hypothetical protein SxD43FB_21395 [Sphingobium sp. D43FB]
MMAIYYSATAHGFFDSAIHAVIPEDAVQIRPTRHRQLLAAQAEGARIEADASGKPRIRHSSVVEKRATLLRQAKREAARRIERLAPIWRQMNDMRAPGPEADARFVAIDAVRAASTLIEQQIASASADQLTALDIAAHDAWPKDA